MFCLSLKNCFYKSSTRPWGSNYISKDVTQQETFLSKYSEYDGRGIKIAILDSGFDVSLDGFQQTSEGLPKVLDCFDFTGAGDVGTSVISEMDSKNVLEGLSGKKLKIPKKWINPSGKWHLGLKSLYKPTMSKTASDRSQKLPELDCIVWFDGGKWCACIETLKKNLKDAKVLTNFRDEHNYGILCLDGIKLTYCITIHNDGDLLQIFAAHDDHGSVVAQVAAAYFPENTKTDGLAPGAQIICMKIWDPEKDPDDELFLQALEKALVKCIEYNVDIINCSFSSFYGDERIEKRIREAVNLHNILIFKCAGNSGPFYATVYKCDKNVEDAILTNGAVLTSEIKKRIYEVAVVDNCPTVIYDFSSRGPGAMSSQGLDFVAPGAAITDKPRFHTESNGGYAGTSYSCPNAAGAVACLLSGLKAKKIEYSPKSIKFVLTQTAVLPENRKKSEFGHGIIQINDAFDYYFGEIFFIHNNLDDNATVEREIDLSKYIEIHPGKAMAENWTLKVFPKTAETFVELLSEIDENNKFSIKMDPTKSEAGSLNSAEISIIDPSIGSICYISVTVVYLLKITGTHNYQFQKEITFDYENPHHIIFYPCFEENSSKKCDIKITAVDEIVTKVCVQYHIQAETATPKDNSKIFAFTPKNITEAYSMEIVNKVIHEFCIYQAVGAASNAKFALEFDFKDDNLKDGTDVTEKNEAAKNGI